MQEVGWFLFLVINWNCVPDEVLDQNNSIRPSERWNASPFREGVGFFQLDFLRCPLVSAAALIFITCVSAGDSVRAQVCLVSSRWAGERAGMSSPRLQNGLTCRAEASFVSCADVLWPRLRKNQYETKTDIVRCLCAWSFLTACFDLMDMSVFL